MFDIQKFTEETADENSTAVESEQSQENMPPIPEEFEGISEEVAREMMAKTAEYSTRVESEFDEVDDEGNYTGEKDLSRVKIPYSRFKQSIDQKNEFATKASEYEKQLALYKQRFGDLDAQPQQNNFQTAPQNFSQQPAQTQEQPAPQPRYFNADDAKQIDDAIKAAAMQMTGFSEEDVDAIDYLDDDDPKIGIWNHAKEMAKIATYNQIVMAQMEQAREEQRRRDLMAQSVNEFQNYTQQQTQAAEYEALRDFAATEFFHSQSPVAQQVIRDADWRLQNKLGTPADFKTIQINMRKDAKVALSKWMGTHIDKEFFTKLSTNPTADRIIYGGTATSESSIGTTDTFSADLIRKAKLLAQADERTMVKPINVEGIGDTYVMVVDQWQAHALKKDPDWIEAQKFANVRGDKNPIFSGKLGIYDGVIVHQCNRVVNTPTGNSGIPVGHALFLGAQAGIFALGGSPTWEEDVFDYRNKFGVSFGHIFGIEKAQFKYDGINRTDFGVINVLTSTGSGTI